MRCEADASAESELGDAARLFSESNSRYLVEVEPGGEQGFLEALGNVPAAAVGKVLAKPVLRITGVRGGVIVERKLDELARAWRSGIVI